MEYTVSKKICFLLPSHYSARMGGAEYQVKLILEILKKYGQYNIHYLCRYVGIDYIPENYFIQKIGKPCVFDRFTRKFGHLLDVLNVYMALKKIKPDVIYQRVGSAYSGIAALYAKRYTAKLIWHISGDIDVLPFEDWNLKNILKYPDMVLLKYGIKHADIIIGQTKRQNNLLQKYYQRKCSYIIPNGHPIPREKPRKSNNKICTIWIANLKPIKQPEIFVRLAKELVDMKDTSFLMIGRNNTGKKYAGLLEEIREIPNLRYLGEVSNDEVNRRISAGHIIVNTSLYEGFSNTFIQAWMRKVPVVSLNVDPDDILKNEGIGFHSKTFEQMVIDTKRLIEDKKLREAMGARAQQYVYKKHSLANIEKIVDLIVS